jgi:uncharacterized membrane protein YfcA
MADSILIFYIALFIIAFLYASVGHGGASGYLALMAIYGISPDVMKPTALLLNLFVSVVSFIQFYRGGHFRMKLFWPLALGSVPLAFVGGLIHMDASIYKIILGVLLVVAVARFLFFSKFKNIETKDAQIIPALLIGAVIGFLSGLIGIGGGIILSPILLLLGWSNMKQTAAISALFIFVNSLAGLMGQLTKGINFSGHMLMYVVVAFAGGMLGAYVGSLKLKAVALKNVLAAVLLVAAYKLLFTNA